MSIVTITATHTTPETASHAGSSLATTAAAAVRPLPLPPGTTRALLHFAVPPERLGHGAERYLDPEVGPSWPLEAHDVGLYDLRPELEGVGVGVGGQDGGAIMGQLETRGFGVLRHRSAAVGPLAEQDAWNAAYLEETKELIKTHLSASAVYIWNSVTRSADPAVNTPYGTSGNFQKAAIKGLQFGKGGTVRPAASGAHVDQDADNSRRMCRATAGEDCFDFEGGGAQKEARYRRVQQINLWRPLRGPVRSRPLAVCDGATVAARDKGIHCGLFGTRVTLHHNQNQKWYYIKHQQPDQCLLIKIYDSASGPGHHPAEYAPHTSVDDLYGADDDVDDCGDGDDGGVLPVTLPRESIEVRIVACYK